jgi:hypothetical protein
MIWSWEAAPDYYSIRSADEYPSIGRSVNGYTLLLYQYSITASEQIRCERWCSAVSPPHMAESLRLSVSFEY